MVVGFGAGVVPSTTSNARGALLWVFGARGDIGTVTPVGPPYIVRGVREKSFFDQKIRNDVLGPVGGARGRGDVWRAIGVNRGALGGVGESFFALGVVALASRVVS